ncbi:MAG: helix-turn-helix transcriptional regulator [Pseudomonadota bacterium]
MATLSLESLGRLVAERRGGMGIREAANEIGISPATLSRVENGHLPNLEHLQLICKWLNIDPGSLLGSKPTVVSQPSARVHFRKDAAIPLETAQSLANMILAAQRALMIQEKP